MKQRKFHISPKLRLVMAALLVAGCLIAAVGISFARYRTEHGDGISFQVDQRGRLVLGSAEEDVFTTNQTAWASTDSGKQLQFAVANGTSETDRTTVTQKVSIRVIGSLGAWNADSEQKMYLTVAGEQFEAAVIPIVQGTALHTQFGDGWEFRFLDSDGKELTWELDGAQWNYLQMQLSVDTVSVLDTSLLRLQAIGEQ